MNRLKEFRERAGKRQDEIAAIINASLSNYCKKEKGDIRVSLLEARLLADYFKTSIDEIFFDEKVSKIETKKSNEQPEGCQAQPENDCEYPITRC